MRIEYKKSGDPLNDLPPLQKATYVAAVALAFGGIFIWVIVVLF